MKREETQPHITNKLTIISVILALCVASAIIPAETAEARVSRKTIRTRKTASGAAFLKNKSPKTLRSIARVYMAYGNYLKARPYAERALVIAKNTNASDGEMALCLIDLATLYNYLNKFDEAEKLCAKGIELQKRALYDKHPYVAHSLRTLSSIYRHQHHYQKAGQCLRQAIYMMRDSHLENDKAFVPFWVDTATLLMQTGNLAEAEKYFNKAIPLINSSYGPDHLYTANILADTAKLHFLQGKYQRAERTIDHVIKIQEKVYGSSHNMVVESWLTKAILCRIKHNNSESEQFITKALAAAKKTGNLTRFVEVGQRAEQIRSDSQQVLARVFP